MNRYLCIHGHFYQPPRENPWLEDVELQDSAYPYHDWNERISAECYAPNAASRILDSQERIIEIVNNYAKISFNFGPTLLSWMESHMPEAYRSILEMDRESRKRFSGHGSALAQAYNHLIMPLANRRDKHTQVLWGIRDFRHRFGRKPEGLWLPETAVDLETLDLLAEQGIKFTLLAPHQARRMRRIGDRSWKDVSGGRIDPKRPYLCRLPSGRSLVIFFYDGPISQDVAFGGLLTNGENFAKRLLSSFSEDMERPQLGHIATDGETYGHHHRYGDMALAFSLYYLESSHLARITIYAEYLEKYPATHEVEIFENTSWSCFHGVERWRNDCGCSSGMHPEWTQAWRASLREAMDWLRDMLAPLYEREMAFYVQDPWQVRDEFIGVVLDRSIPNVEKFFARHAVRELSREEKVKVLKLLEMQRHALLMQTSCGWFFDEISGIEPIQIIQYAARAMQLAREVSGVELEPAYLKILERAPSNVPTLKTGARVYEMFVKPAMVDLLRVGAHYAMSSMFVEYPKVTKIYCYTVDREIYDRVESGKQKVAIGRVRLRSDITWEERDLSFAVLHLGDHNLNGGVRELLGNEAFASMAREIKEAFLKGDIPEVVRLTDKHFDTHNYSLWHLFKHEQRKALSQILSFTAKEIEGFFQHIYDDHYPIMQAMNEMRVPLPKSLAIPMEYILNLNLRKLLESEELDIDRIERLIADVGRWSVELDKATLGFIATQRVNALIERLFQTPEDLHLLETVEAAIRTLDNLHLGLDVWKAQNIYFSIGKQQIFNGMRERVLRGDAAAEKWVKLFNNLGNYLHVRIL